MYYQELDELPMERKAYGPDELEFVALDTLAPNVIQDLNNLPLVCVTQEQFEANDGFFGDWEIAERTQYFVMIIDNRMIYVDTQGYTYARYAVEIETGI